MKDLPQVSKCCGKEAMQMFPNGYDKPGEIVCCRCRKPFIPKEEKREYTLGCTINHCVCGNCHQLSNKDKDCAECGDRYGGKCGFVRPEDSNKPTDHLNRNGEICKDCPQTEEEKCEHNRFSLVNGICITCGKIVGESTIKNPLNEPTDDNLQIKMALSNQPENSPSPIEWESSDEVIKKKFKKTYDNMKQRCSYKDKINYRKYGARGIKCLWASFGDFRRDMFESYCQSIKENGMKNTTIDRINVDGHYCKENCRWSTILNQQNNRRHTNKILIGDVQVPITLLCRAFGLSDGEIEKMRHRVKVGGSNYIKEIIEFYTSLQENHLKEEWKEFVICAAIRMKDGYIIRGHRHSDALRTAAGIPRYKGDSHAFGENQGFVTSTGRYVDRIEGAKIQKAAGIKSKMPEDGAYLHGELYSEDLY